MVRVSALAGLVLCCAGAAKAQSTYPATDADGWYSNLEPLPKDVDLFTAYKKIFFSTVNETVVWWYLGLSSTLPDGLPEGPGIKSQTIQAWRIQHFSPTRFRADWAEPIIVADFATGEDIHYQINPLSGMNVTVPNYYYDGPVTYYLEKNGSDISVEMHQPGASILRTNITAGLYNGDRILIRQIEEKIRGGSRLLSTLMHAGSLADVRDSAVQNAQGGGYYYAAFAGALATVFGYPNGTQGRTHILGNVKKGGVADDQDDPVLWAKYQAHFPEFFDNGVISPNWTHILTSAGLEP